MKKTVILLICALLAGGSAIHAQNIVETSRKAVQIITQTEKEVSHGIEILLAQELIRSVGTPAITDPYIFPELYRPTVPDTRIVPDGGATSDSRYPQLDQVISNSMRRRTIQNTFKPSDWKRSYSWNPFQCLNIICKYQDENPDICFVAGDRLMDFYWGLALHQDSSYWAWSAYLRENLRGKHRDKALAAIMRTEEPALTRALISDNYYDCAYFCLMYPTSSNYYDIFCRLDDLLKRDRESDTLGLIAGQYSHKDSALVVLNNVTYGTVAIHTNLYDKISGERIMTTNLTPCSDATQVAVPIGRYSLTMEYKTNSDSIITDTIELNVKQYVYNVQIFVDETDSQLLDFANASVKSICNYENSLICKKHNSIRDIRALERESTEELIDKTLTRVHNRYSKYHKTPCGQVDMTGANIGTTLILQNILLSYFPHELLKKNDRFVVYTIHANDDMSHAPIIVAAPCYPKTPIEVEQREQALRTLDFFLAADTMANPKQHGTIHFVFYKMDEYLYKIGDLFKGKTDSPRVALAFDEWVIDTINVESPDSQGNVTFTPPVQNIKLDYSNTTLPHALYHLSPAMAGVLPESIYSVLR